MNKRDRFLLTIILTLIAALIGADVVVDTLNGAKLWHLILESTLGLVAIFGIYLLYRGNAFLKAELSNSVKNFETLKVEADTWRAESKKYVLGLAESIDLQLSKWKLSAAEKEVAFLLLKGLSLKEIAEIRQTTEKTARAQSIAVYAKAGLAGRSELSAFFLEDLLVPHIRTTDGVR